MRVVVGFVLRAHGIQGWIRVRSDGDSLLSLKRVRVGERDFAVLHAQPAHGEILLQLEGVTDRDQAEALKGLPLSVEREALPAASDDEVYLADLIGCGVFDLAGKPLGEVIAVESSGGQDLLTVKGERTWQLPFVDGLVTSVDVAEKKIVCDPPEGLLDL